MHPPSEPAGRGAAVTTAVLSLICAAFGVVLLAIAAGAVLLFELFTPSAQERWEFSTPILAFGVIYTCLAVAFTVGAVKLLRHNPSGRIIIIVSSALYSAVAITELFTGDGHDVTSLLLSAVPILTLVSALLPGTKRWCEPQSF